MSTGFIRCAQDRSKLLMEQEMYDEAIELLRSTMREARRSLGDAHAAVRELGWHLQRGMEQVALLRGVAETIETPHMPCAYKPKCKCLLRCVLDHLALCMSKQLPISVSSANLLKNLASDDGHHSELLACRSPESLVASLSRGRAKSGTVETAVSVKIDDKYIVDMRLHVKRLRHRDFGLMRQLSEDGLVALLKETAVTKSVKKMHVTECAHFAHRACQKSVSKLDQCICISNPYGLLETCLDAEAWLAAVDEAYSLKVQCTGLRSTCR
jgi:hypothetical protein